MTEKEDINKILSLKTESIQSLREVVVSSLREAIIMGHFKPGDHLKERELSETMGVSTTPIKEAFRILGHEGLVVTVPRRGTFVSELADTSIQEIQMLRAAIEGLSARLATQKATEEQLAKLESQVKLMESLLDRDETDQLVEENTTFHKMIIEAADAPMISHMLSNLASFDKAFRKRALEQQREKSEGFVEHRDVLDAIKSRNPELAEQTMKQHILRTATDVLNN